MDPNVAGSSPVDRPLFSEGSLTWLQALLLGIVQGVTEFFPVSSSAHLRFVRWLFDLPEGQQWLYFDLACHAGTWIALVWFLRREVLNVLQSPKTIAWYAAALIPLVPAYFLLKPLRIALSEPRYTGLFLIATAGLLIWSARPRTCSRSKWRDVLWIGSMQAMALLPGLSRSGSTIAAARLRGWDWLEGARFSFLLAVPTIFGGELLESAKLLRGDMPQDGASTGCIVIGALSAFAVGLLAVRAVFWLYERECVRPFAWYCFGFGLLTLWVWNG